MSAGSIPNLVIDPRRLWDDLMETAKIGDKAKMRHQGGVRRTKTVLESALPRHRSGRAKLAPLGQSGGAAILKNLSADEGSFLIEVVVDRAVQGGEFLQTSHQPEAEHRPLSSSKRLVGILGAIVQPAAGFALVDCADGFQRDTV